MLKYLYIIDFQKQDPRYQNAEGTKFISLGHILVPTTSLFNHSCDPNISIVNSKDSKIIAYALKPIKKDEQVSEFSLECFSYLYKY